MKKPILLIAFFTAAGLAGGAWMHFAGPPQQTTWQGWVEGDFLFLGADEAGRLASLDVKEGQGVAERAPLFAVQSDIQDAEWQLAKAAVAEATARLERMEAAQQRPEEIAVIEAQESRAHAAIEQSKPELERAKALVAKGFSPESRLDAAKAAYNRDMAALAEIERQISVARLKARSEDIQAAQTVVAQAESRLASAETRRQQRTVSAPVAGTVQEVFYRQGEIVPAGRPVVSLLPLYNIKVRFFVPQAELPRLKPGTRVLISCDGCAANIEAEVTFLSTEAEFTPPVIFSREEREKLVFRIEARPLHPELLRVGQPVTVTPAFLASENGRVGE